MPSFRSASSGQGNAVSSYSCNKPAGTVAGDALVACQAIIGGDLTTMGTPTGGATWLPLDSAEWLGTPFEGMKIWWKIAGSSEPASYGLTQFIDASGTCSMICVQGAGAGTPVVAHSGGTASTTSIPTPSTTPNGADDFEIRFVGAWSGNGAAVTFTPPAGLIERTDLLSGTQFAAQSSATRVLSSSGATGVKNFTSSRALVDYLGFTVNIGSTAPAAAEFIGWGMRI